MSTEFGRMDAMTTLSNNVPTQQKFRKQNAHLASTSLRSGNHRSRPASANDRCWLRPPGRFAAEDSTVRYASEGPVRSHNRRSGLQEYSKLHWRTAPQDARLNQPVEAT